MAAYSGKEGSVAAGASNDINELREWSLEYGGNIHEYASRAGAGSTQTVMGVNQGSGRIVVNYDDADRIAEVLSPGALVTLTLKCTSGGTCSGSGRIGKHSYNPKLSGEEQQVTVPFVCHGAWTLPT